MTAKPVIPTLDAARLARAMTPVATSTTWKQLALPDATVSVLREVSALARTAPVVTTLFVGGDAAAHARAATAIAADQQRTVLRVDLSAVVSKYIGETEKNLDHVFLEAERLGVVLLFDEGDALFGKRSDVKDSHDRFANTETDSLLQRLERFHGVAILATHATTLDDALLRRFRYVVRFPAIPPPPR